MSVAATRIIATALITFTVVFAAARASCSETATPDDTARFLAGLRPSPNSPLAARTNDPVWISHARNFDAIFAREQNTHLPKIREFSEKYLTTKHDTVLYMFSGPDFLYATSFFPTASTYVLAGLEPVGRIPELANLGPFVINGELRNLEGSLGSLFNYSFFITQHMKSQCAKGRFMAPCRSCMFFWREPERLSTNSISLVSTNREISKSRIRQQAQPAVLRQV